MQAILKILLSADGLLSLLLLICYFVGTVGTGGCVCVCVCVNLAKENHEKLAQFYAILTPVKTWYKVCLRVLLVQ